MLDKRNGTIRTQRSPKDLLDSSFQLDKQSFWELMGYLVSYLEKLNYYNIDNEMDGNWKKLVEKDPIIYMVMIVNTPSKSLEEMLHSAETNKSKIDATKYKIDTLLGWYDTIVNWHLTLTSIGEKQLGSKIKNIVRDVLDDQKKVLDTFKESNKDEEKLQFALHTFEKIIGHIQRLTKNYLNENINSQNTHMPHNAMYIAFVQLYKNVQDRLNTIAKRHLDFYYKDVLQQEPSKAKPTRATLVFELLPTEQQSLIEEGTKVSAGKLFGATQDILFETQKSLRVHQMIIAEMHTLFFNTNPYIEIGTNEHVISSAVRNNLIRDGKIVEDVHDWFVFGANKESLQNTQINAHKTAPLGFIVGSPVLNLSEGYRTISLHFNLDCTSAERSLWKLLKEIKAKKNVSMERAFSLVFEDGFMVWYSTQDGWTSFKNYSVTFKENSFTIHMALQKFDPAVQIGVHMEESLKWPSVKVLLNEFAPIYGYSFLKDLEVKTITIDVEVSDIRNIALYNNVGKMPLGKPFETFGPSPVKGSYIMVGKSELFQKELKSLDIDLHWDTVPEDYGGFTTYYDGYSKEITNSSFVVKIQALTNSYWVPFKDDMVPSAQLFSTEKCITPEGFESEIVQTTTTLSLSDFKKFNTALNFDIADPLKYDVNSPSGFLKITLTAPSFGFGNDIYHRDFTEIATYNAKSKRQLPYPNTPFVPKLKGVSLNYSASDTLFFDSNPPEGITSEKNLGEFIHIGPSGLDYIISEQKIKKNALLPKYDSQGYLFLGLKGIVESSIITMFFHFLRSGTTVKIKDNEISWEYFHLNSWAKLTKEQVIHDGTGGLTKTGIIELLLPKTPEANDHSQDAIYWLRISTKKFAEHYPKIKGVYLNAVQAVCTSKEPAVVGKMLPAFSIDKLEVKNAQVKQVYQPASTYAGVVAEKKEAFYSRVSERIRHKSRAVASWDFERLILEKFETVKVVKCTNFTDRYIQEPGQVKVVVLSKYWTHDERYYFKREALDAMRKMLEQRSNPFINIEVVNPTAEYLLVNTVIEFVKQDRSGFYIEQLNDDISNYLSPIKNIEHGMGGIGGKVIPNMLVSYIESLSYVKQINKLSIEHIIGNSLRKYTIDEHTGGNAITTTTPWSVLAPVKRHHIVSLKPNESIPEDALKVGIKKMQIGLDFILNKTIKDRHDNSEKANITDPEPNDTVFSFKNKT